MAESAASTPAKTVWDFLTSDGFLKCLLLLVTFVVGVGGTLTTQWVQAQRAPATIPVALPDLPRPSPLATIADLDHSLSIHGATLKTEMTLAFKAMLDEKFPAKKAGAR